ncbi:hypothetical protein, partial [Pseudomonas corrugata]|uniref:hypothetical protein n=1 Tax=Pseudomonas corrugata TaxID=47879 RepID=UPI0019D7115B
VGARLARDSTLSGDISLSPDISSTNQKTLFALFVYKSIIRFVRVSDQQVNYLASLTCLKARKPPPDGLRRWK